MGSTCTINYPRVTVGDCSNRRLLTQKNIVRAVFRSRHGTNHNHYDIEAFPSQEQRSPSRSSHIAGFFLPIIRVWSIVDLAMAHRCTSGGNDTGQIYKSQGAVLCVIRQNLRDPPNVYMVRRSKHKHAGHLSRIHVCVSKRCCLGGVAVQMEGNEERSIHGTDSTRQSWR